MANDEHVALLKKGVAAWNAWRRDNPGIRPDFSGADLRGVNLTPPDDMGFSFADLGGQISAEPILTERTSSEQILAGQI